MSLENQIIGSYRPDTVPDRIRQIRLKELVVECQATLKVTPEGVSASLETVFGGQQPIVLDETWLAWAEIIPDGAENWAQAKQLQDIERIERTLTAKSKAVQESNDDSSHIKPGLKQKL